MRCVSANVYKLVIKFLPLSLICEPWERTSDYFWCDARRSICRTFHRLRLPAAGIYIIRVMQVISLWRALAGNLPPQQQGIIARFNTLHSSLLFDPRNPELIFARNQVLRAWLNFYSLRAAYSYLWKIIVQLYIHCGESVLAGSEFWNILHTLGWFASSMCIYIYVYFYGEEIVNDWFKRWLSSGDVWLSDDDKYLENEHPQLVITLELCWFFFFQDRTRLSCLSENNSRARARHAESIAWFI